MIYQVKYKNDFFCKQKKSFSRPNKGFSIVEILIAIGIIGIIFSISMTVYGNLKTESNLKVVTSNIVESIRYAKNKAESREGDSNWGVSILSDKVTIFMGPDFISRDMSRDIPILLPPGITASGLQEITFDKMTGKTNNTDDITISNNYGTKNIEINSYGTVSY